MAEVIRGTLGNDTLTAKTTGDTVLGLEGNDVITGLVDTFIAGNLGNDSLTALSVSKGKETLYGAYGGKGNDTIKSQAGTSVLHGDVDNDILIATFSDTLFGGVGNDSLIGQATSFLFGGKGKDTLYGSSLATLAGDKGSDVLIGTGGGLLYGDDLTNTLKAGDDPESEAGNDSLVGVAADTLLGGGGNDTLNSKGSTLMNGNIGDDLLTIDGAVAGTTGVTMYGGQGNDTVVGANGGNALYGDKGDDSLKASTDATNTKADTLYGGAGSDILEATNLKDTLVGGASVFDTDSLDGADTINGKDGDDLIYGNFGNDSLVGAQGLDTILGGAGNDYLFGGGEFDSLAGGEGNDSLIGGLNGGGTATSAEILTGDAGNDFFFFVGGTAGSGLPTNFGEQQGSADTITDFQTGIDKIVLDGQLGTAPTTGAFTSNIFSQLFSTSPVSFSAATSEAEAKVAQGLIVYVKSTGDLYYNPNGTAAEFGDGANPGGKFASLNAGANISFNDFIIV